MGKRVRGRGMRERVGKEGKEEEHIEEKRG